MYLKGSCYDNIYHFLFFFLHLNIKDKLLFCSLSHSVHLMLVSFIERIFLVFCIFIFSLLDQFFNTSNWNIKNILPSKPTICVEQILRFVGMLFTTPLDTNIPFIHLPHTHTHTHCHVAGKRLVMTLIY